MMGLSSASTFSLRVYLLSWKQSVPNLTRCFSTLCDKSKTFEFSMTSKRSDLGSYLIPHRNFYKQLIEVNKRISWRRPAKVHPAMPEKSGDLSGLPELDASLAPKHILESSEYETAPDLVKRVVSINFQNRQAKKDAFSMAFVDTVKCHAFDEDSIEAKMARLTVSIRRMQNHILHNPRDGRSRFFAKQLVDRRKKKLGQLRKEDYRKFEWLLERLDILFKPRPMILTRVEKKASIYKVAAEYERDIEKQRLNTYRETLESKKPDFFRRKLSAMKSIVASELSFDCSPSFTKEEIQELQTLVDKMDREEQEAALKKKALEKEEY